MNIYVTTQHTIDLDAPATIPANQVGLQVLEHKPGGQLVWNSNLLFIYCSGKQKHEWGYSGHKLGDELAELPVANANLIDFILPHPELIEGVFAQADRHGTIIRYYCWGTKYVSAVPEKRVYIRCFYFDEETGAWAQDFDSLDNDYRNLGWRADRVAIVFLEEPHECVPPHTCQICAAAREE